MPLRIGCSAGFAIGKFALRGLAQSIARELAPKGIHVAHFVIDGGVRNAARGRVEEVNVSPDSYLRATCTSSSSRAAPGRGRWNSGPGSSGSDPWLMLDPYIIRLLTQCSAPPLVGTSGDEHGKIRHI